LIFCRWLILDHISEFIIDFPSELMSGNYFLKYSSDTSSKCWIFTHKGKFNEYNWYIAYGLTIDAIEGLEVRLAIPRTVHPYTVVEHLDIIGDKRILTDGDSHWLSLDLDKYTNSQKRVIFGYKAWIKQNFLLFHPESLKDESRTSESAFFKQCNSTISLIYQISHRIHQHVKYHIQKGEFGAKYAVLNRQGDCTEYSALFVAMCRQQGIPSRLVAGFKKTSHNNKIEWIRHAWAEFLYNGQWIPIDILEGFVIGNFPENIPLFRGNWIGEAYKQELKVIVKNSDAKIDLSKVYLDMKYDIFGMNNKNIPKKPRIDNSSQQFPFSIKISLESDSRTYDLNLKVIIKANKGKYNLLFYIQENNNIKFEINHPKIIIKTFNLILKEPKEIHEVLLEIPLIVNPEFLLGCYLCTDIGEIKAFDQIQPSISLN
ncbi:MAG: transglutaminase-like domain-containing protein, partial [Candidatus Hodarchaeales archaeon]